jgi:hypothetical protein
MTTLTIHSPYASQTLNAAVLSAALAAAMPASTEDQLVRDAKPWESASTGDAAELHFHLALISHHATPATTKIAEPDPWQELELLEKNWDGEDAEPVSLDAIQHAKRFLVDLPDAAIFTPFANPDGRVGLQGQQSGKSAYLLISAENLFTYVLRVRGQVHRGHSTDAPMMRQILEFLF